MITLVWMPVMVSVTLAILGMMWRGEAWKWECRRLTAQLSQLLPQSHQSLPKTAFSDRGFDFLCAVFHCPDPDLASPHRPLSFDGHLVHERQALDQRDAGTISETPKVLRWYSDDNRRDLGESSLDKITCGVELPYRSWPNTY
jgi:hypothetical protein